MANDLNLAFKIKVDGSKELAGSLSLARKQIQQLNAEVNRGSDKTAAVFRQSRTELGLFNRTISESKGLITGFFSIYAAQRLVSGIVDTNREFEKLRAQLKSITGDSETAARIFQTIQRFAADTPFQVQGLTTAFIQLRNYGIEPTNEVMLAITNQAAKLGGSQETLTSIVQQLGQAYSKGKLQQEDMLVLAERGVPIYQILAEATGRNAAELEKMSANGELTKDTIDQVIVKMGELASGSNAAQMDTLNGKISNLSDSWARFEDALLNDKSEGALKSIVSGVTSTIDYFTERLTIGENFALQLQEADAAIEKTRKNIARLQQNNVFESVIDSGIFRQTIAGEENKLRGLLKQRDEIVKNQKFSAEQGEFDTIIAEGSRLAKKQVEDIQQAAAASKKAAEEAIKAAQERAKLGANHIAQLQREVALQDDSSAAAAVTYDITFGRLKDISSTQKEQLLTLADQKDAIRLAAQEYAEFDAIIAEGVRLAQQQNDALDSSRTRLREKFKPADVRLEKGIADVSDARDLGVINDDEAKRQLDKLGSEYNAFFDSSKSGFVDLNAVADQASRNMQTAFASFLFDPFQQGLDGMLAGFLDVMRQMVAEIAAKQAISLLFRALNIGGGAEVTAEKFGGIMTSDGPVPLKKYASGGVTSTPQLALFGEGSQPEAFVPLPDGRTIPVTLTMPNNTGSAGGNVYNITVNMTGDREDRQLGNRIAETIMRRIAAEEIASANRRGNILNPVTVG